MMKRLALVSLVVLSACTRAPKETTSPADIGALAPKDSEPRKTLVAMLNWHRTNESTLGEFLDGIVVFQILGSDSTIEREEGYKLYETDSALYNRIHYRVSRSGLERYLTYIDASGFFSKRFVNKWRLHVLRSDSFMQKNRMNDGPPRGFEFVWITSTQDYLDPSEGADTLTWFQTNRSDSAVSLTWILKTDTLHTYELVRQNGKWLIDDN